jgi:hypothetical protein
MVAARSRLTTETASSLGWPSGTSNNQFRRRKVANEDQNRNPVEFTVGIRFGKKVDRIVIDAEDALIAALKVKAERPEAAIMYVRRSNRRGDKRHPSHTLTERRRR